jgi:hypothetical protein
VTLTLLFCATAKAELKIRYCYDGQEAVTTNTTPIATLYTPPSPNGESRKLISVTGGSTSTHTGAPNAIVLEQSCDSNKLWKIEASYDGAAWFELAKTSTNYCQSGQSILIHKPPQKMLFREREL